MEPELGESAVLDDAEARSCARTLGVQFSGTLGVIVRAYKRGLVPSLLEAIDQVRAAGLYVDDALVADILRKASARRG